MVGEFEIQGDTFPTHAYLYTGREVLDLGTLGGPSSGAGDINDAGQVLGFAYTPRDASGRVRTHVFLYADGTMRDLGSLIGPQGNSYGGKLNASGQVVGFSEAPNGTHAFLYSAGVMTDLGTLGGGLSYAYGINANSQVIGSSSAGTSDPYTRAFIYTDGAMYDLNHLVIAGLGGAMLTTADAINDNGQIIAHSCIGYCIAFRLDPVLAPAVVFPVVEFYSASLDHYFITWMPNEIAILDAGTQIRGWARTGYSFKTYTTPQAGTSPVCRYYIPPGMGDSHFFGRGTVECNATGQKNPTFVLEDPAFMHMFLPVQGVCPANTTQVYRVFSNRPDANHRYMTNSAVRDQMMARGWLAEGDGPDLVVMCAPQ